MHEGMPESSLSTAGAELLSHTHAQGLGKTVEVLGLILAAKADSSRLSGTTQPPSTKVLTRATLVVCAVSLVGQWVDEAKSKSSSSLRIHQYHGQSRLK